MPAVEVPPVFVARERVHVRERVYRERKDPVRTERRCLKRGAVRVAVHWRRGATFGGGGDHD